jgi:phosphoenolpyruvate phosphomutase
MPKKTTQLKSLISSPPVEFLMEAHNGISAKIVEEAGFKGIWASGLSIAAQFGVRDNNEASWTQVLEVVEFMADATQIPILLDGDTGYGDFNNMRRLVNKLEQRGVAGVCIEDKLFPKTNSFIIDGTAQPLADIQEFCGKIKAGKDAQHDDDFCIVARVEAFIAGQGLEAALQRAKAYHAAGADAILIHSALRTPDEVLAFKQNWDDLCPVIIVPTKYYATPTEVFHEYGFSLVIWANQTLRSAVTAMQKTVQTIKQQENLLAIEDQIVPVAEIFRLQGADELQKAEQHYLPPRLKPAGAIILAASRGDQLGELTATQPKAMVKIAGKPLLAHSLAAYREIDIKDITVVRGFQKNTVNLPNVHYVDNDDYANSGELFSLQKALDAKLSSEQDFVICYGDILFKKYIPALLCETEDDFVIAVDTQWQESANRHRLADYVTCTQPSTRMAFFQPVYLTQMAGDLAVQAIDGEWMGFFKVKQTVLSLLRETLASLLADSRHKTAKMPLLFNTLIKLGYQIRVIYTTGHWLDVDSLEDVVNANALFS